MHAEHRQKSEFNFLWLIPVFIVILIFIFNMSLSFFQERALRRTTEDIIYSVLTTNVADMRERLTTLFEQEGYDTEFMIFSYTEDTVEVYNVHFYNRFLGTINFSEITQGRISFNNTGRVDIALRGTYRNGEVTIEVIDPDDIEINQERPTDES